MNSKYAMLISLKSPFRNKQSLKVNSTIKEKQTVQKQGLVTNQQQG